MEVRTADERKTRIATRRKRERKGNGGGGVEENKGHTVLPFIGAKVHWIRRSGARES